MSELLPVNIDGETIYIETEAEYGTEQTTSAEDVLKNVQNALEHTKITIVGVAKTMVGAIQTLDQAAKPEEFVMEFAIKFTAEGNVVVAKVGGEANLKVSLKYNYVRDH